jgi:hypothetical protein
MTILILKVFRFKIGISIVLCILYLVVKHLDILLSVKYLHTSLFESRERRIVEIPVLKAKVTEA